MITQNIVNISNKKMSVDKILVEPQNIGGIPIERLLPEPQSNLAH
ncbi:hypothetical protein AC062_1545 [Pasteurellaceae bacterium NI1060]|nr:hypothetical protein AC062_1545 [Pasteurellaceae bacterium NI1060]